MFILFIIVGAIVGGITAGGSGVLLGGCTGYLLWQVQNLRVQLEDLQKKIRQFGDKLTAGAAETAAIKTAVSESPASTEENIVPRSQVSVASGNIEADISHDPEIPATNTSDLSGNDSGVVSPEATTGESKTCQPVTWREPEIQEDPAAIRWIKNYFTTGNTLVRVGVIILFFGVAFLVKYAAEQGIVPIELRMAAVAFGGLVMLVVGWRTRAKNADFALAAQGGGIGVIYLTTFAALRLYELLPASMAFFVLFGVCAMSSILAVLQNSRALAILGFSGGFLAPILTSTGEGSHVALFSYYTLLNAGILGIAWYKSWRVLNLIGFVFTFVIATSWGVLSYRSALFVSTEPFLLLFFLFYVAISVLYALRQPINLRGYVDGTLVFGTPIIVFGLQLFMVRDMEYGLAYSAMAACVFYVLLAYVIFKFVAKYNSLNGIKLICESFLSIGVVFGTVAIPLALDDQWTAATWALEGSALVYVAIRQQRTLAYFSGFVLQAGAAWFVLQQLMYSSHVEHWLVINGAYLSALLMSVAGGCSAYLVYRYKSAIKYYTPNIEIMLLLWAVAWWLVGGVYEIVGHGYVPDSLGWWLLLGVLTSVLAHGIGNQFDWQHMQKLDNLLLIFMLITFVLSLDEMAHPFVSWLGLSWLVAYAIYVALLKRNDSQNLNVIQKTQHSVGFWLLLILMCWEGYWWIEHVLSAHSVWSLSIWMVLPALTLPGMIKLVDRVEWPFKQHAAHYLGVTSLPVVFYTALVLLVVAISNDGNAAPLDYVPLLNPLDVALLCGFICLLYWWQMNRRQYLSRVLSENETVIKSVLAALMFVILTTGLLRTLHHWADIPYSVHGMIRSDLAQTSLTLLWSLLAVATMILASKKAWRTSWLAGAGLIAVVVVKLFMFDLANVGTVERIISFIGVGVLMLGVGYFAPLPAKPVPEQVVQHE